MAKRLKLRICRVISNTLQSCRSKDPSNHPQHPTPLLSSFKFKFNPAFSSSALHYPSSHQNHRPEEFKWRKEHKWHVVSKTYDHPSCSSTPRHKIYNSSASASDSDDLCFAKPPPPPLSSSQKKKRRSKKKRSNIPTRLRVSTSSADSGWFSAADIDEEETETLVSSSISCLSTDTSSDFNSHHQHAHAPPLQPIREKPPLTGPSFSHHRKIRSTPNNKRRQPNYKRPALETEIPARLSMFHKLIPCTVEGKVKESFAVVKRSSDPFEDFKNSMMDMIVEKQMFEAKDLEQLLQCFLSLNSRHYHGIIVEAFSEIWEAIFSHRAGDSGYWKPASGGHQYNRRRPVSRLASF